MYSDILKFNHESKELIELENSITKGIVKKINTKITYNSSTSGYWSHLAFLIRTKNIEGNEKWTLYAYLRGRFKSLHLNLGIPYPKSIKTVNEYFKTESKIIQRNTQNQ